MSNGIDRRAQIDADTVKGLLLINGGGAVSLMALLPSIVDKKGYEALAYAILIGIFAFMFGLVLAVTHNHFRRKCSLEYQRHKMRPPKGKLFGFQLWDCPVCCVSTALMWCSLGVFLMAGLFVTLAGMSTLDSVAMATQHN